MIFAIICGVISIISLILAVYAGRRGGYGDITFFKIFFITLVLCLLFAFLPPWLAIILAVLFGLWIVYQIYG